MQIQQDLENPISFQVFYYDLVAIDFLALQFRNILLAVLRLQMHPAMCYNVRVTK